MTDIFIAWVRLCAYIALFSLFLFVGSMADRDLRSQYRHYDIVKFLWEEYWDGVHAWMIFPGWGIALIWLGVIRIRLSRADFVARVSTDRYGRDLILASACMASISVAYTPAPFGWEKTDIVYAISVMFAICAAILIFVRKFYSHTQKGKHNTTS